MEVLDTRVTEIGYTSVAERVVCIIKEHVERQDVPDRNKAKGFASRISHVVMDSQARNMTNSINNACPCVVSDPVSFVR